MPESLQSDRTTVKRLAKRGVYDRDTVNSILDEAYICHAGFVVEGQPMVIPTIHWRDGETLYLHGSAASHMLRTLREEGVEVCVTVTLLDGLVIARSAFNHSMNYRSAVVLGHAREVSDPEEKRSALEGLVEHVLRGRSLEARAPNEKELRQTIVLALPITEASAKVRTGGPLDDEEDYALDVWAGVIPLELTAGAPVTDVRLREGVPVAASVAGMKRRGRASRADRGEAPRQS